MNSSRKALLLRADASTQIGAGHVMRCLALAQAWQDAGGQPHFAAAQLPEGLATRLTAEGIALHRLYEPPGSREDAVQTAALAQQLGAAWVVEDGYHFGTDYQRVIKDAGLRLLAIDDYGHAGHYVADLVLNQNIYANESLYPSRKPTTRLLLGTRYVLLRREFLRWRNWQRQIPEVARKVLVTMGGSDPDNVTLKVVQALTDVNVADLEIVAVVGASNPHLAALQEEVRRSPHVIRIEQNVTNMPELMAWADVAVSSGGSTCWELAFMGVPSIILVLAENQRSISEGLDKVWMALDLGWHLEASAVQIGLRLSSLLHDYELRFRISTRARTLVDGMGPSRVVMSLLQSHPKALGD